MGIRHKLHVKQASLLFCLLVLTLLLAACGGSGRSTPTGKTYNGDSYQFTYPQDWTYKTNPGMKISKSTEVLFTSKSDPTVTFDITDTTPIPGMSPDNFITSGLDYFKATCQGYQQDSTVPSTASVGGTTWKQIGGTGDRNGQHLNGVSLAVQYPASTGKVFTIIQTAKADSYGQVYNTVFKPVLESFKFT